MAETVTLQAVPTSVTGGQAGVECVLVLPFEGQYQYADAGTPIYPKATIKVTSGGPVKFALDADPDLGLSVANGETCSITLVLKKQIHFKKTNASDAFSIQI